MELLEALSLAEEQTLPGLKELSVGMAKLKCKKHLNENAVRK